MLALDPKAHKTVSPSHNVHGIERAASIGGGLLLIAKGLSHGGLSGLLKIGLGGMGLMRGFTGHCEAKRVLQQRLANPTRQTPTQAAQCCDTTPIQPVVSPPMPTSAVPGSTV
ncbi:MAG: DUF2892 domain-containing protein [Gammaproteobacteria bacterium]|nr:DUF2892 domain-containing protein [Gammaproteobacteria bacterium]MBU1490587.1 DUF2892 domain-containing protein [Gammaproteobacteria bacterium]MBU2137428.1 DUF2892 domain-containing protein [Gammaproteobacteria bacterium]MBU2218373.1 DUF2892 domain-containing protein [Gammaproteobacteria bacterium]MBU2324052.1 DUF2892 domain-containing protein [Gammaproteobacteria bacterium]